MFLLFRPWYIVLHPVHGGFFVVTAINPIQATAVGIVLPILTPNQRKKLKKNITSRENAFLRNINSPFQRNKYAWQRLTVG